jgi:cholesterol transport system auxiliary component
MRCFIQSAGVVLTCASLSGCAALSTLSSASAPTDLYVLTPKSTFDPNLPRISQQIVVAEPTATAAVNTDRITVQPTPLEIKFLPGVRWVDLAPVFIQTLLIESYENSGKVGAVGRSEVGLRADYVIITDVREFQARVPANATPDSFLEVHVRLNIKVIDADLDKIIASRSFEFIEPAISDKTEDIVAAFDDALGDSMRGAVEWSIRKIYADAAAKQTVQSE